MYSRVEVGIRIDCPCHGPGPTGTIAFLGNHCPLENMREQRWGAIKRLRRNGRAKSSGSLFEREVDNIPYVGDIVHYVTNLKETLNRPSSLCTTESNVQLTMGKYLAA